MAEIEITSELLAELRRKAEACEPKVWILDHEMFFGELPAMTFHDVQVEFTADAEHMAAADPATVLALVAEIERMQKELGVFRKHERERWESFVKAFGPIQKSEAAGE